MRERIEELKYSLITEFYAPQREMLIEILRRFDRLYRERKRQAGALDFADLEEFAVRLLVEHPDTRARLQAQFDHILMDEFQDTNGQQAQLLELVRPPGPILRGGRHQPIHLRFPPRRAARVSPSIARRSSAAAGAWSTWPTISAAGRRF